MQLFIEFFDGEMIGQGSDIVGEFVIKGEYALDTGGARFQKHYPQYFVYYDGKHSGKAIGGLWHLPDSQGRFIIWHESVGDPTIESLEAEAGVPVEGGALANTALFCYADPTDEGPPPWTPTTSDPRRSTSRTSL